MFNQIAASNPAIAPLLQSSGLVGQVAKLGALGVYDLATR